jgi:hypothetical protein
MRAVRDFEVRADVWAARWLRATGYDVGDYVSYLKRLNPPAVEERLAAIDGRLMLSTSRVER